MDSRTTLMEKLNERVSNLEKDFQLMGSVENLLDRLNLLEENIYTTKKVLTFNEACFYLGVSPSLLYKLMSSREVPHYKPRGKMLYFNKEELNDWLMQNNVPTISAITKAVEEKEKTRAISVGNVTKKAENLRYDIVTGHF